MMPSNLAKLRASVARMSPEIGENVHYGREMRIRRFHEIVAGGGG